MLVTVACCGMLWHAATQVLVQTALVARPHKAQPLKDTGFQLFLLPHVLTWVRSTCLMSSAQSSSAICPPVQSIVSTRNSSPSDTSPTCVAGVMAIKRCWDKSHLLRPAAPHPHPASLSPAMSVTSQVRRTAGMSGCHRLWRGLACSHGFLLMSTVIRGVGVLGGIWGYNPASGQDNAPQHCCSVNPCKYKHTITHCCGAGCCWVCRWGFVE